MTGKLVIISGPSGVGKSTICKELLKQIDNAFLSVSMTTRCRKNGEKDGENYWFVSREEFEKQIRDGNLLEYAEVFGNFYGTPKDKVITQLQSGKTVILEIDVQGGVQVKEIMPDAKTVFILPPKHDELQKRIDNRGRDEQVEIEKRLAGASTEIAAAWQHYKNMVINDDLQQAVREVVEIVEKD